MESSTVLAFRIFVMLSCLVVVPLAAIFGSAFPDVVKSLLVDRIVAWSTGKPVESRQAARDGFREVTPQGTMVAAGQNSAPPWNAANRDNLAGPRPASSDVVPAGPAGPGTGYGPIQAASLAAHTAAPAYPAAVPLQPAAEASPYHRSVGVPQAARDAAAAGPSASAYGTQAGGGAMAAAPEKPDRFSEMERKLRESGATYYLLETWGNDGQLYRFHCRMAVGDNPNYTRHFEATDRDALTAMAQVLERVEAWRAGRLP
jgi:hypothetical protein